MLGANDGIVSTASLIVGVAAAGAARGDILLSGIAGLVAGALSMAAGEYVSVSSQADSEAADLLRERGEMAAQPEQELAELTNIYVERGVPVDLARQVADHLSADDAVAAHARDELGISDHTSARPIQAALTSALTFSVGAALPLTAVAVAPSGTIVPLVSAASLALLAFLGAIAAKAGGASLWKPTVRATFWGALAMPITAVIGRLLGAAI